MNVGHIRRNAPSKYHSKVILLPDTDTTRPAKAHPSQQVPCIVHRSEIQGTQLHLRHKELPVLGRQGKPQDALEVWEMILRFEKMDQNVDSIYSMGSWGMI
jgi:hypothetical protein